MSCHIVAAGKVALHLLPLKNGGDFKIAEIVLNVMAVIVVGITRICFWTFAAPPPPGPQRKGKLILFQKGSARTLGNSFGTASAARQ